MEVERVGSHGGEAILRGVERVMGFMWQKKRQDFLATYQEDENQQERE